jgi:phosphohistidine phosphatase
MHQLLLLRHAKSSWEDASLADRDRALTARGRRAATAMRRAMRELGLAPDVVLVSTSKRTLETMSLLEPWDDTPLIEPMDELYLAGVPRLFNVLRAVAETVRSVLVIGHNPGLHDCAIALTDADASPAQTLHDVRDGFPTGALAEFSVIGPWARLDTGGARLLRFLTPKMLDSADTR